MPVPKTRKEYPPVDIKALFDVQETGSHTYVGVKPLSKPSKQSRGAYGGNIAAQAVLVGIRSSPPGFTPNSLHSYFIRPVSDALPVTWKVEEISNGRTFVNRSIHGLQNGVVVYTANISLTLHNSTNRSGHRDRSLLNFSPPPTETMKQETEDLPTYYFIESSFVYQKIYPFQNDDKSVSFLVRLGITDDAKYNRPLINSDEQFKYVGVTVFTDWIALDLLLPHLDIDIRPKFQASIDHCVYYHEDDFILDQWFIYVLRLNWVGNDRALVTGDIYTMDKRHIITVVQERLFVTSAKI